MVVPKFRYHTPSPHVVEEAEDDLLCPYLSLRLRVRDNGLIDAVDELVLQPLHYTVLPLWQCVGMERIWRCLAGEDRTGPFFTLRDKTTEKSVGKFNVVHSAFYCHLQRSVAGMTSGSVWPSMVLMENRRLNIWRSLSDPKSWT